MPAPPDTAAERELLANQLREYRWLADEARKEGLTHALAHLETRIAQLEQLQQSDSGASSTGRSGAVIVGGSRG